MRTVVHLTASTFYGGPERQMSGLANSLPPEKYRTVFISFREGGRCQAFIEEVRRQGFEGLALRYDTPRLRSAMFELKDHLERVEADVLCCHGYKANLVGRPAARRLKLPVAAVSRGWTGANFRLRLYEGLDRINLRWMDRVVCVSEGQADLVRQAGVPEERILVIRNAILSQRFDNPDPTYRDRLQAYFPEPRRFIIGAAGRLSPEKGFGHLIQAAETLVREDPSLGFVLFGHGVLEEKLARQIAAAGLQEHFVLGGFRDDLDQFFPYLDLLVLPSYAEGLPNVVLEAFAARVPVVATTVGGTPEVVEDGESGYLVAPGDVSGLTDRIREVIVRPEAGRRAMGLRGQKRVREQFSFATQSEQYQRFFDTLVKPRRKLAATAGR